MRTRPDVEMLQILRRSAVDAMEFDVLNEIGVQLAVYLGEPPPHPKASEVGYFTWLPILNAAVIGQLPPDCLAPATGTVMTPDEFWAYVPDMSTPQGFWEQRAIARVLLAYGTAYRIYWDDQWGVWQFASYPGSYGNDQIPGALWSASLYLQWLSQAEARAAAVVARAPVWCYPSYSPV